MTSSVSCGEMLYSFTAQADDQTQHWPLQPNTLVLVNWEHTLNGPWYRVELRTPSGIQSAWVPKTHVKLCPVHPEDVGEPVIGRVDIDGFLQEGDLDEANAAPPLEPDLNAFSWPLTADDFIGKIFNQRRVYSSHAAASRLQPILDELPHHDDFSSLIESAEYIYVWMSTPGGVSHQFSVSDPTVAKRLLASGGSLYLAPSCSLAESHLKPLAQALFGSFAVEKSSREGLGGDIEVFVNASRHVTAWHFDNQDGFNVQLVGTKIWQLVIPNSVAHPLTNQTNSSQNESRRLNRAIHRLYAEDGVELPGASVSDDQRVVTVLMRPGSVLYVPRGTFHRVICDDNDGSLSCNFSFSGIKSYSQFVQPAIQALLAKDVGWRQSMRGSPLAVQAHLHHLLQRLPSQLESLSTHCLLPPVVLKERKGEDDANVINVATCPACDQRESFVINPLASLISDALDEPSSTVKPNFDNYVVGGALSLLSEKRKCSNCSGDPGLLGSFCRFCGHRLDVVKVSSSQSAQEDHESSHPWFVYVCPPIDDASDDPISIVQLIEIDDRFHSSLKELALNRKKIHKIHSNHPIGSSLPEDWRRLCHALQYSGFLISVSSTFDPDV